MCSAPSVKMPKYEAPDPLPAPPPLPEPAPLPTPRAAAPAPVLPPPPAVTPMATPPAPPPQQAVAPIAPPPQLVQGRDDEALVKKRKSKRKELQQASSGTDALRIPLDKSIGATPKGSTGSSGLNIPR